MIILNERIYAEQCLRNLKMETKPFQTLTIIGNYFFHAGYNKKRIFKELRDFFIKADLATYSSNKRYWDDTLELISSKSGKYPLHELDGVWITHNELNTIKKLKNKLLERLAFTLLCLAKLNNMRNPNNNYWVNNDYKEIFNLARITCKKKERYINMGRLYRSGLIELAKRIDNLSVRVTFADSDATYYSRDEGDLFISDFRELGYEYLYANGGNFIRCAECGILVRGNKQHTKKYCKDCAGYTPIKTKRIICSDCGRAFEVSSLNSKTTRCEDCQKENDKRRKREWKRKQMKKVDVAIIE